VDVRRGSDQIVRCAARKIKAVVVLFETVETCPVKHALSKQGRALKRAEHVLRVLDAFGCAGQSLGVGIQERPGAQREEDGTDKCGNDDSDSIA